MNLNLHLVLDLRFHFEKQSLLHAKIIFTSMRRFAVSFLKCVAAPPLSPHSTLA